MTVAWAALLFACAGGQRPAAEPRRAPAARPGTPVPVRGPDEAAIAIDSDGDGRPDLWRLEIAGPDGARRLVGTEQDANGDGRVDRWVRFAPDGSPALVADDLDFDGRADVTFRYADGALVSREDAVPGLPRTWRTYAGGKLVRVERDLDGDGRPDAAEPSPASSADRP